MDTDQQCSRSKGRKKSDEKEIDWLSNLPDPIIHHILSFLEIREAIQTSMLSKKWRFQWTYVHSLIFYITARRFYKDETLDHVFQHRKPIKLVRLKIIIPTGYFLFPLVEKIFEYAEAHNVEAFEIDRACNITWRVRKCQCLKTFKLCSSEVTTMHSFDFAFLTSLHLCSVSFYGFDNFDMFKDCLNMESLRIEGSRVRARVFNISAPRLINLFVSNWDHYHPKRRRLVISAPTLKFLDFDGKYPLNLTVDKCSTSLEKVNIHMFSTEVKWAYVSEMLPFVDKLSHARKLKVSFDYSGGKLLMQRDRPDEEIRIVEMES